MSDAGAPPPDPRGTLNPPRTEFSPRADLAQQELRTLQAWSERSLWTRMRQQRSGAEPFVLAERPLEARGPLRADGVLDHVLKDIALKYRHLSGARCERLLGWDTHGLSPELERAPLAQPELQRLGVFGSGEAPYRTAEPEYVARELRELATLVRRGLVSRRTRPLPWCLKEGTVLGEHEVEQAPRKSPSAYVAFRAGPKVAERFSSLKGREVFFVTWTLAPWSLPGHVALSVNADFEYVFYDAGERVLCVAKDLLAKVLAEVKADELVMKSARLPGGDVETVAFDDLRKILVYASGEELAGLSYQHPFLARPGRVVLGGPAALEEGTGLVHVAPGLGHGGSGVDAKPGLELYNPVDRSGRYDATVGSPLQGVPVLEADPIVLELLAERGALLNAKQDAVEHAQPRCQSCHQPVIRAAFPQWFITLDATLPEGVRLRQRVREALERVKWIPARAPDELRGLLAAREEWCISRQRSQGVPLPIASCEGCGAAVVSPELIDRVAAEVEKHGSGAWQRTPIEELLGADFRCASCGGRRFRREADTLDPQFDAACMFPAVLGPRQHLPADLCVEGSEQLDGWLLSSMVVGVGARDAAPYRACVTHGRGVDEVREEPKALMARHGAELLRLWAASSEGRSDVPLSNELLQRLSLALEKFRHALAFALGHLYDFEPARDALPASQLLPVDDSARGQLAEVVARALAAYEAHEPHRVCAAVMDFCAEQLSAGYFPRVEERLRTSEATGRERRSAQTVLFEVASSVLRVVAPILSFTAEEAWQHLPGRPAESVFLAGLPQPVMAEVLPPGV